MTNRLKVNYTSEVPTDQEIVQMWKDITITELNDWSKSAEELRAKFSKTHINGGIQLHKYSISDHYCFQWFASRNRLSEIFFIKRFFNNPELANYRADLEIENDQPNCEEKEWSSDIFDLSGIISRLLHQGGAYGNLKVEDAWRTAINFVKNEYSNRFNEINRFTYHLEDSAWFFHVPWDYSIVLFDKRTNEVIVINITDTD